jgi:lauroyl/myristoyl acyltransferase
MVKTWRSGRGVPIVGDDLFRPREVAELFGVRATTICPMGP